MNIRASIRRLFAKGAQELWREFRDLTPLSWGDIYPGRILVSEPAMLMLEELEDHLGGLETPVPSCNGAAAGIRFRRNRG